jgi:hypothetical protein
MSERSTFKFIFKGTVSRDFRLLVFFMNQFPQAHEYTIRAFSNFFENSRRYSQLKVLPLVSLTPVANLPPVSTTLAKLVPKFAAGDVDTGGNFAAGVVDTGGKFATGVVDTGGAP